MGSISVVISNVNFIGVYALLVVYTLFALSEYIIVLSNMAYHGSAIMEFGHGNLLFVQPLDTRPNDDSKQS